MNRREFQIGALTATAAFVLGQTALAAEGAAPTQLDPKKLKNVVEETRDCIAASKACITHCVEMFKMGDKSMANCHAAVLNTLSVCEALNSVAQFNTASAEHIKKLASVCAEYCRACAEQCKPHVKHSKACAECLEACENCAKACDKLANA